MKDRRKVIIITLCLFCIMVLFVSCEKNENDEIQSRVFGKNIGWYKVERDKRYEVIYSYTDGKHNYYIVHLGIVENVPLESTGWQEYDGLSPITLAWSTTEITENSIAESVSKCVSNSVSKTKSISVSTGRETTASAKVGFSEIVSAEVSQTISRGIETGSSSTTSTGYSVENTYSTASSYAKQKGSTYSVTVGNNGEEKGRYCLALVANCDMYVEVKLDVNNEEILDYDYIVCAQNNTYFIKKCYAATVNDIGQFFAKADVGYFDVSAEMFYNLPKPTKVVEQNDEVQSIIKVAGKPKSCKLDNDYNMSEIDDRDVAREEVNPYIFDIYLKNCEEYNKTFYKIDNKEKFGIFLHLMQLPSSIDIIKVAGSGIYKADICNDSTNKAIDTNINEKIKKGAVYIKVTYKDGTKEEKFVTDILKNTSKGDEINVLKTTGLVLNGKKEISSISLDVVYEIAAAWRALGFLWDCYTYTNWRVHKEFTFV